MPPFNWNDLRFFLAMARTGSPASAALQLKVDHTTVRRRISALEEALNARLFEPRDRGFFITSAGERMLTIAEEIESLTASGAASVLGKDMSLSGSVRIGVPDGLGSLFLSAQLARFANLHPDLEIELDARTRPFNLAKREADIAISITPPTKGRQTIRKLVDCNSHLYASAEYLEQSPPIETLEDLQNHRFVGYFEDMEFSQSVHLPTYLSHGPRRFVSTSLVALYEAVLAGVGICFLPQYLHQADSKLVRVLPDKAKFTRPIWMAVHSDLKDIARYRAVVDFLRNVFRENRHLFID